MSCEDPIIEHTAETPVFLVLVANLELLVKLTGPVNEGPVCLAGTSMIRYLAEALVVREPYPILPFPTTSPHPLALSLLLALQRPSPLLLSQPTLDAKILSIS